MDPRAHTLLRQAAEWRLIGLLFECPAGSWRDDLVALARDIDDPLLRAAVTHALEEASEGLYHSTFGPGGPAPPREVTYVKAVQLGYLLSELTACRPAPLPVNEVVALVGGSLPIDPADADERHEIGRAHV